MSARSMTTSRWSAPLATLVVTLTMVLILGTAAPAMAQETEIDTLGRSLVEEFVDIAMLPDEEKAAALETYLAPEFLLVRESGEVMDRAAYIEAPSSVVVASIDDVVATQDRGVLVVSWTIEATITIDGVTSDRSAPRLSVFHEGEDGRWQLAAHANFSTAEPVSES